MASTKFNFFSNNTTSTKADLTNSFVLKAWKYVPNLQEALSSSSIKAGIDILFGKSLNFANPAASNIIRDFIKSPAIFFNSWENNHIGHTDNIYDSGTAFAQATKMACKSLIVFEGYYFHNTNNVEQASRISNYICEVPNRVTYLAAMQRQNDNLTNNTTYIQYLLENYNNEWLAESVVGGVPKVALMDIFGQFIAYTGITNYVKHSTTMVLSNIVPTSILDLKTPITLAITGPIANIKYPGHRDYLEHTNHNKIASFIGFFAIDYTARFTSEVVNTYIYSPTARFILDAGSKLTETLNDNHEFFQDLCNKIQNIEFNFFSQDYSTKENLEISGEIQKIDEL